MIAYNIYMKNNKAVFLTILGTIFMSTGFAFAESLALEQLKEAAKATPALADAVVAASVPGKPAVAVSGPSAVAPAVTVVPAVPAPAPAKPKKNPIMEFIGDNFSGIVSALAIALIAFLVIGTGGAALAVGAAAFGAFYMIAKL